MQFISPAVKGGYSHAMRLIRFMPIAFIADFHGFALFAPYVAVVLTALHIAHYVRTQQQA
jgi:hypothetical protein